MVNALVKKEAPVARPALPMQRNKLKETVSDLDRKLRQLQYGQVANLECFSISYLLGVHYTRGQQRVNVSD